jgi:hypothetical protein
MEVNVFDELTYSPRASNFLAEHLQRGTLVLFLGAGVSKGMGLPNWVEYVNKIRQKVCLTPVSSDSNAEDLQIAADEVENKCESEEKYFQILKSCLYEDIEELSSTVLKNDLITAVCALLMGSKRGNIRKVITLNFDSMIEWFLSLYGFITRVVYQLPALEGAEDVRIYHPHGFLPHGSLGLPDSDFVILGLDSINKRLGTPGDLWFEMVRHLLRSSVCLFVGLSDRTFSDRSLAPLLTSTGEEINKERPTGIWMLKGNISESKRNQFLRNNVVPLELPTAKDIADFLLGVCRKAAVGGIHV